MGQRVLITGITSFTGCYIGRAFVKSGNDVMSTLTRPKSEYSDPAIMERVTYSEVKGFVDSAPFGSSEFLKCIEDFKPEVFINHGASIKGYRNADFDVQACVERATLECEKIFTKFATLNTHVIHSGSVFERDSERGYDAYSPYGEAKTQIWEKLRKTAQDRGVKLSKVVITDPVGPFENTDRLAPLLFKQWYAGEQVEVRNPEFIWDRIPAEWLAQSYIEAAQSSVANIYRPSAFVATNLEWIKILEIIFKDMSSQSTRPFMLKGEERGARTNTELCKEVSDIDQATAFFNSYGNWLLRIPGQTLKLF
ncbi:MAG: NAD-dependent epimerase/dehydratase family protein [Bdellovibrionota bacterium]